ncbi:MAG: hypothetical protein KDD44_10690, partial [Bdellovibrionales bacterium]|nr:hypothetical protein [Bdellovibrionales bacterium]
SLASLIFLLVAAVFFDRRHPAFIFSVIQLISAAVLFLVGIAAQYRYTYSFHIGGLIVIGLAMLRMDASNLLQRRDSPSLSLLSRKPLEEVEKLKGQRENTAHAR